MEPFIFWGRYQLSSLASCNGLLGFILQTNLWGSRLISGSTIHLTDVRCKSNAVTPKAEKYVDKRRVYCGTDQYRVVPDNDFADTSNTAQIFVVVL